MINLVSSFLSVLLPFVLVLTVVVFIHELGHFLVARWCGVAVRTFSIGFGQEIWGFHDRYGTRWRLAWIPLGGFVKFVDDENAASAPSREALERMSPEQRARAFQTKPLHYRAAIVAAGPIANFIAAIVLFAGLFSIVGVHVTAPRVDEVVPGSVAEQTGFQTGDVILRINGAPVESFSDMQRIVSSNAEQELTFEVNRHGEVVTLQAAPALKEITDRFGNKLRVGVIVIKRATQPEDWEFKRYDPITSVWLGIRETEFIITKTLGYVYNVIVGRESADQLGGPIRIAEVSGQVASAGIVPLVNLMGVLSVSIGLINLFPIPLLDGGHLLFYAFEAVRRRPLSERTQEIGFRIGLAVVLMLMMFATWNDLGIVRRWLSLG
jgi:regulator of sigma E protease